MVAMKPNPNMNTLILDVIRGSKRPMTAVEICDKSGLKRTMTNLYLKRLRDHINEGRAYARGYKFDKKRNNSTHLQQWIYFYK